MESVSIMKYMYLNKFFQKKMILEKIFSEEFKRDIFLDEVTSNYLKLKNEYNNEFFFKNTIFNKYLLGKYSLKTSVAFGELSIEKSKADFCIINKQTGMIFEIKTELDNLERITTQISDYYKAFSYVSVVTTENNYYPVLKILRKYFPNVGIIILTDKFTLSERKKAEKDDRFLSHRTLFKILRKAEYEELINSKFYVTQKVRPVEHFEFFYSFFVKIEIKNAQSMVYDILRRRVSISNTNKFREFPESLRWIMYSANLKEMEYEIILKKLNE